MLPLCSSVDITTTNLVDGFKIANNRTFIVFLRRVERLFNLLTHNVHVLYCTTGIVHCMYYTVPQE